MFYQKCNYLTVLKLSKKQSKIIREKIHVDLINYPDTFFTSIDSILKSKRVVSCHNTTLWKNESAVQSKAERIYDRHTILEFSNGYFTISSEAFDKKIREKKWIHINEKQFYFYKYR